MEDITSVTGRLINEPLSLSAQFEGRGHGLISGIADLFAFGANLQISRALPETWERTDAGTQARQVDVCMASAARWAGHAGFSSFSSTTCIRLMETFMCQRCPGVAKTKIKAEKKTRTVSTNTSSHSELSVSGRTRTVTRTLLYTRGPTIEERTLPQ